MVAPDLRGHGESDKPVTGYRLRDFAEDVHQLIANLKLERPAYAGHSWGGNIGTMLASDHPEDISRAFLEDPVYWRMQHAFVTALPGALARLARPEEEIRAEARERGLSPEQEDWEVYRNRHFSPHALTRLLTDNRDWALASEERLRRIQVPTLILVGDATVSPQPGAILFQELGHLREHRLAAGRVRVLGRRRPHDARHPARRLQRTAGTVAVGKLRVNAGAGRTDAGH